MTTTIQIKRINLKIGFPFKGLFLKAKSARRRVNTGPVCEWMVTIFVSRVLTVETKTKLMI